MDSSGRMVSRQGSWLLAVACWIYTCIFKSYCLELSCISEKRTEINLQLIHIQDAGIQTLINVIDSMIGCATNFTSINGEGSGVASYTIPRGTWVSWILNFP